MSTDLDVDKGPAVLTTLWAISGTACVFVIARLLVRVRILQRAGWDDWLITLSMMIGFIYAAIISVAVHAGYGKHTAVLSPSAYTKAKIYNLAGFIPGLMAIVVPKLAVVALLVRTMNPSSRQRWFLWVTVMVSGLLLMGCVVILYAQCQPAQALWDPDPQAGKVSCWSPGILVNYSIVVGAIAAAVDAYLAIYPAVIIWKLHMSIKKKVGLSLALGLGAGACVMALVKCTRLPSLYHVDDPTYATADLFIWTSIESNTIIIAACVPTIAPLIEVTLGKRFLATTDKDRSNTDRLAQIHGRTRGQNQSQNQEQRQAHIGRTKAKAWISSINVERSYHQCSIQRGSDEELRGLDPSLTPLALEEGFGTVVRSGIQRRDDVIIEYGRWPETNSVIRGKG